MSKAKLAVISNPSNDGKFTVDADIPYAVHITVEGACDLLFHRWSCEDVEAKEKASKGSAAKKTDNIEAYVWRNDKGHLCIPSEYLRQSIIHASKFKKDPRSPRKSAMDLFKAGVVSLTDLASLGVKDWDYLDKRRVTIMRSSINRTRPAIRTGWRAEFHMQILTPEYIDPVLFQDVLNTSGRLVGIGDFRPTFGRFNVVKLDITQ